LWLAAVCAAGIQAQPTYDKDGTERFHKAFYDERANEVSFEPFQEINWDAKARAVLTWLNLDLPTPAQITRLAESEGAGRQYRTVDFRAPLDPAVRGARYLLIHDTGIVPIAPVQLKGSVDFDFDEGMTAVTRRYASGTIVGKPVNAVKGAAFAIVGKPAEVTDLDSGAKLVRRKQSGSAVYDFADGHRTVTWTTSSEDCSDPKAAGSYACLDAASAVSFRLGKQHWLLVRWTDDFCGSAYTLFSVGAALALVAGNHYGCDI